MQQNFVGQICTIKEDALVKVNMVDPHRKGRPHVIVELDFKINPLYSATKKQLYAVPMLTNIDPTLDTQHWHKLPHLFETRVGKSRGLFFGFMLPIEEEDIQGIYQSPVNITQNALKRQNFIKNILNCKCENMSRPFKKNIEELQNLFVSYAVGAFSSRSFQKKYLDVASVIFKEEIGYKQAFLEVLQLNTKRQRGIVRRLIRHDAEQSAHGKIIAELQEMIIAAASHAFGNSIFLRIYPQIASDFFKETKAQIDGAIIEIEQKAQANLDQRRNVKLNKEQISKVVFSRRFIETSTQARMFFSRNSANVQPVKCLPLAPDSREFILKLDGKTNAEFFRVYDKKNESDRLVPVDMVSIVDGKDRPMTIDDVRNHAYAGSLFITRVIKQFVDDSIFVKKEIPTAQEATRRAKQFFEETLILQAQKQVEEKMKEMQEAEVRMEAERQQVKRLQKDQEAERKKNKPNMRQTPRR